MRILGLSVPFFVVLIVFYLLGARFPFLAQKVGLA